MNNTSGTVILAVVAILFLPLLSAGQDKETRIKGKDLPAAVDSAFKSAYPTATIKAASREVENGAVMFEIESVDGSIRRDLLYSAEGMLKEVEELIPVSGLPVAVGKSLKKEFPGASIKKVERLRRGDEISYELELRVGKSLKEVVFEPTGALIKGKPEGKGEAKDDNEDEDDDD